MTEQTPDLVETPDEGTETEQKINFRREWEKSRKEAAETKAVLEKERAEGLEARKELLARKVGVDPDSGPGKLLLKAYDGELTEDAFRTAAAEYGVIKPLVPETEQQEYTRVAEVAAGSEPGNPADDALSRIAAIPEIGVEGRWDGGDARNRVLDELRKQRVTVTTGLKPKSGVRWVQYETPVPQNEGTKNV